MTAPEPRVGGRVLMLDPDGRVLLIHERLDVDTAESHWLTPGGGLEAGETPREAAAREAYEETGVRLTVRADTPEVHTTRRLWSWAGAHYDQVDHFFVADVAAGIRPVPRRPTPAERTALIGHRWWTAAELRATRDRVQPADLADVLDRVTAGPPATPRLAGRVLLLDPERRVLLQHCRVDVGAAESHWITPGGGAEPDETPAAAAARELYEEHGVRADLAGATPIFRERKVFGFAGGRHDQTDEYFVWHVDAPVPLVATGLRPTERATFLGARWWTVGELRASTEVVHPHGLADLLDRLRPA